jgi:hypothetical protein
VLHAFSISVTGGEEFYGPSVGGRDPISVTPGEARFAQNAASAFGAGRLAKTAATGRSYWVNLPKSKMYLHGGLLQRPRGATYRVKNRKTGIDGSSRLLRQVESRGGADSARRHIGRQGPQLICSAWSSRDVRMRCAREPLVLVHAVVVRPAAGRGCSSAPSFTRPSSSRHPADTATSRPHTRRT